MKLKYKKKQCETIIDYILTMYKKWKEVSLFNTKFELELYEEILKNNHIEYIKVQNTEIRIFYGNELLGIIFKR